MIPEALIVALSGSVSNHWSRVGRAHRHELDEDGALLPGKVVEGAGETRDGSHSRGRSRPGSGGAMDRIGLMNLAISTMNRPYSS